MVRSEGSEGQVSAFDTVAQQATRRAQGYWLLSRLFLEVPSASMLAELRRMLADADKAAISPELGALRDAVDSALADPTAAAVAYTRHLGLGDREAGEPLPFEAHVREVRLPGECTQQVAAAMSDAGYGDVAPDAASPDHLGAELRFMAMLCHDEQKCWQDSLSSSATGRLEAQKRFLEQHLACWAPDYCRGLAGRTSNAYLRAVANLAAAVIEEDLAVIAAICDWFAPNELATRQPT